MHSRKSKSKFEYNKNVLLFYNTFTYIDSVLTFSPGTFWDAIFIRPPSNIVLPNHVYKFPIYL